MTFSHHTSGATGTGPPTSTYDYERHSTLAGPFTELPADGRYSTKYRSVMTRRRALDAHLSAPVSASIKEPTS